MGAKRMMSLKLSISAATVATLLVTPALAGRGSEGTVNILYWQAASTMNPYLVAAAKDLSPASLVLEPLAKYDENGKLIPWLAQEIPTIENGGVSADFKSITWKLKPGLKWSDGTPVTAKDVVFTANYCMNPKAGCAALNQFDGVDKVEAPDDLTARVEFNSPRPVPYGPFVSALSPIIQAKQFADCQGEKVPTCTEANFRPIGTGPYIIASFKPNDSIQFKLNPHYRDSDKPHFAEVNWKGGGDAAAAARAVLQTGEYDYAWNMAVAPDVLKKMEAEGKGRLLFSWGPVVESLWLNLTDPSSDLSVEERSTLKRPNPILGDIRVRKALSMAMDRAVLNKIIAERAGRPTCDVIATPKNFAADNTGCLKPDMAGANQLLDEAGWKPGLSGIRQKGDKKLKLIFTTSTSPIRQQSQEILKQWWREIGVDVELRNLSGSVFFGSDPSSPDTYVKSYHDIAEFTFNSTIDPASVMARYTCEKAPKPGAWQGSNVPRYCDKRYDELVVELGHTGNYEKRGEIVKQLNNMLTVDSYTILPIAWTANVDATSNTLLGPIMNPWENSSVWNIQDWHRKK